jgi:hypothetical protein
LSRKEKERREVREERERGGERTRRERERGERGESLVSRKGRVQQWGTMVKRYDLLTGSSKASTQRRHASYLDGIFDVICFCRAWGNPLEPRRKGVTNLLRISMSNYECFSIHGNTGVYASLYGISARPGIEYKNRWCGMSANICENT